MEICTTCKSEYDKESVNISYPLPDKTCSKCGTELSDVKIAALIQASAK